MDKQTAVKILREIAAPGSGHLFSRREVARYAADMIEGVPSGATQAPNPGTSETIQALEWATTRAHVETLGKPIVGPEARRWRVLLDLLRDLSLSGTYLGPERHTASVAPAAGAPTQAEFVIRALVAAGHVTQAKVDEAIEIARKTPGVAAPAAPLAATGPIDWHGLLDAVMREARREDGYSEVWKETESAPGHAHDVAGIWDSDNHVSIAGKPCSWCLAWNAARAALATPHGDKQS